MNSRIYADYCGTTPVADSHFDRVVSLLKKVDGNPSSIHAFGREAKVALEDCRASVARLLGADDLEIIFTSGATESNNLVLQGYVGRVLQQGVKPRVVISAAEHTSVDATARLLHERGQCELVVIPVDGRGYADVPAILAAVDAPAVLVSVVHVNNEVGTVNPIEDIAARVKAINPTSHFHTDSVQALGKLDLAWVGKSSIDSVALSSHKVGGLKGTGGLFLRRGRQLNTLIGGGGQERARRAGTENMPGILSFGCRADELQQNPNWLSHCHDVSRRLREEFSHEPRIKIHGDADKGIFTTINFHVDGVRGEDILLNFDLAGIAVSAGSACSSGASRPSRVLLAMGHSEWESLNSIRISLGERSTVNDVERIMAVLTTIIKRRS